jgi:hypothetical protein
MTEHIIFYTCLSNKEKWAVVFNLDFVPENSLRFFRTMLPSLKNLLGDIKKTKEVEQYDEKTHNKLFISYVNGRRKLAMEYTK